MNQFCCTDLLSGRCKSLCHNTICSNIFPRHSICWRAWCILFHSHVLLARLFDCRTKFYKLHSNHILVHISTLLFLVKSSYCNALVWNHKNDTISLLHEKKRIEKDKIVYTLLFWHSIVVCLFPQTLFNFLSSLKRSARRFYKSWIAQSARPPCSKGGQQYPLDNWIGFGHIYSLNSTIQAFNNWGQTAASLYPLDKSLSSGSATTLW